MILLSSWLLDNIIYYLYLNEQFVLINVLQGVFGKENNLQPLLAVLNLGLTSFSPIS